MGGDRTRVRIACWVGDALLPACAALASDDRLTIVALGGPTADAVDFAARLGIPHLDDPRQLAATTGIDAVVLMDPERRIPADELTAVMSAAHDRPLLSMAVRPGGLSAFLDESFPLPGNAPLPLPIPWFRGLRRGRRLLEAAETFGPPASASIEITGPGPDGLLTTRLLDAFDLLSAWFGLPAVVEACGIRPIGVSEAPIRRLFAIARYPDGRAASVSVGADGGRHQRSVSLHGAAGRLRVVDDGMDWSDAEGGTVEFEPPGPPRQTEPAEDLAESIDAIVRGLVPVRPAEATLDLLAVCEACMLSARTGEPEAIERVRRMLDRV